MMKIKITSRFGFTFLLVILMVLTLSACGSEDIPEEGSKGLLYQVEGGDNQVYLFGSVHVGNEEMYPLHESVYEAFAEADVLGMEIDMMKKSEMEITGKIFQKGMYQDDRKITDLVSEETYQDLIELLKFPGVDEEMLKKYKPWYAASELSVLAAMEAGYNPELGVENYLIERAEEEGMESLGLETISMQYAPEEKLSDKSQVIYLEQTMEEMEEVAEELEKMVADWKDGDLDMFAEIRSETIEAAETESLRKYHKALTDGRDEQMAQEIEQILHDDSGKTYFITVGSLHLAGENSIVEQLEDEGYEVNYMY